ncbi:Rieske (2Fe-2S) protein [Paenibacillus chondroitinus]|uniref:Rieske (2Fe-2S) protein n=1 Tax=Paenibacillus chondroitinus TaxID=59842 RepID=A0ABU6DIU5_9BACL|nr:MULTISPECIES: Rieske (2Fe-2S) protein [Paenibacillus]MCY9662758.1 Rieske (2Fe-2S) protein [Paenibacillus anseongense]MEB4797285.1 Rieske (2Fe-2S) protein [Paenibacillus chondroitinus]
MTLFPVSAVDALPEGSFKIVQVGKRSVGVYNVKGDYFAVLNYCPHQGAELCKGPVCGTTLESNVFEFIYGRDQEIVRCPWHGWEFDLKTGTSLFSEKVRTRSYPVVVENGTVHLVIGTETNMEETRV